MKPCYVTTSWDDGHPSDLRIAEMLARHNVPATFYIPASSQFERMDTAGIRELGQTFEVGAHTLRHLRLNRLPDAEAAREIVGSKDYNEQLLGMPCTLFAPPGGRFGRAHLAMAEQAGFHGFRTTELMSLDHPKPYRGMAMMATTLQVFPHRPWAYWKNALRHAKPVNLTVYLRHGRRGLIQAFESLLDRAIASGGVVHLWGHGWEIEERNEWNLLAGILECLAERRSDVHLVSNSALCNLALQNGHS